MSPGVENTCTICNSALDFGPMIRNICRDGRAYDVFFCEACKVGVTVPMPSREELSRLYSSGSYRADGGKRFNRLIELLIYISRLLRKRRIRKYIEKGRILDIGCGRGLFLHIMRKGGWEVAGLEFDRESALNAREAYGIPVSGGELKDSGFPDGHFDVITMSHVLEHLTSPQAMIAECRRLLRKGGLLICAVPDISSPQASAGKGVWFHLDVPYHTHHFSEAGLLSLLRRNSFGPVRVRRFDLEYNPFGWLQTLLNRSGIRRNLLYDFLKNPELRKREPAGIDHSDIVLTVALLPFYLPLSLLLSVFESYVLRRGGTVEVFAVRE